MDVHGRVELLDLEVLLIRKQSFTALVEAGGKRVWVSLHAVELYEVERSVDARARILTCLRRYAERKGLATPRGSRVLPRGGGPAGV